MISAIIVALAMAPQPPGPARHPHKPLGEVVGGLIREDASLEVRVWALERKVAELEANRCRCRHGAQKPDRPTEAEPKPTGVADRHTPPPKPTSEPPPEPITWEYRWDASGNGLMYYGWTQAGVFHPHWTFYQAPAAPACSGGRCGR